MTRSFAVVLVAPRDPNNIGAAARAMANFGLSDLRVVNPYAPSWRCAVSAVGAEDILQSARLFDTLPQALSDCQLSLATTALRNRRLDQNFVILPHLTQWLNDQPQGKTALVFGNEKTGLSNEDIEMCSAVLTIPTTAKQPSVNLAQAVILTCYELAREARPLPHKEHLAPKATFADTERVVDELESLMRAVSFRDDYTTEQRKAIMRTFLRKGNLSKNDLFFLKNFAFYLHGHLKGGADDATH